MTSLQLFARLGVALAIGLLMGIERGWDERAAKPGARTAGIRTFALIGLLGGIWQALAAIDGTLLLGFAAAAFSIAFAAFEWAENRANSIYSATGMVAGLLTFALGAFAVSGAMAEAAAAAVAATLLLAERQALHTFVERLRWPELRAALVLLVMTVVMLPLLPNKTIDPWNSINPYELWAMTAAIAALSYAGYVCVRLMGERRGLLVGALAAALVSSTAVTVNYATLPRSDYRTRAAISSGISGAWAMSLARMTAIAIVVAPGLTYPLLTAVSLAVLVLAGASAFWYWRSSGIDDGQDGTLREPFDLMLVLRFGLLLAVVVFAYKLVMARFGDMGLVPLAAVSGTADVDPITLAVSQSAGASITFSRGAMLILLAGTTNFFTRATVLLWTRDWRFALPLIGSGALAIGLSWLVVAGFLHIA